MKNLTITLLSIIIASSSLYGSDLRVMQLLNFSSYLDIDSNDSPIPELEQVITQPIYLSGFYYLDARLQNLWNEAWLLRSTVKGKGIFSLDRYEADLRLLYFENRKPLAGHFYISAGRMNSPYMLPVQRLDGASLAYSFDEKGRFLIGAIGGIIPEETVGYRDYYYPKYRVGAFVEINNEKHDMLKLQYNTGFEDQEETIHQAMLQGYQSFDLFKYRSYVRTGILFTAPQNVFDYAFGEFGMTLSPSWTHSLSYIKNEVVYYLSPTQSFVEDFQEAYYRVYSNDPKSDVRFNISGGYSYSMGAHGYVAQANLFLKKMFMPDGTLFFNTSGRNRGVYHQVTAQTGYQIAQLFSFLFVQGHAGYEYFKYRDFGTNAITYGLNTQTDIPGNFSLNLSADFRSIFDANTEVYVNASLFHYLGVRFEENKTKAPRAIPEEQTIPGEQ